MTAHDTTRAAGPGRRPGRPDDPRGEALAAGRPLGRRRRGRRRRRPAPARHDRRRPRLVRGHPRRARPADPPVRHRAGRPRRGRAVAGRVAGARSWPRTGSASRPSCTRSASTGFAAWGATVYPTPLAWGATFDPELVEEMAARIGASMRAAGRAPGPRAGARRDPRLPLGPHRGDDRRGPVPGRHRRHRLRPRPGGRGHRRHAQALRRVLGSPRRPQPRARLDRARASSPTSSCRRSRWRSATAARAR